jgi:Phosphotransferase enzyme family
VIDGTGKKAVLKWSPNRGWAPQIERAARAVAKIRSAGYPTPAWLAVGVTTNGLGYHIQELVPGRSRNQVTAHGAELLIDVLERHAGLDPDPQRCWSQFVTMRMNDHRDELLRTGARHSCPGGSTRTRR